MRILCISGGGTKISSLLGAVTALRDERFDVVAGISAGAVLTVVVVGGGYSKARRAVFDLKLEDFFSQRPVDEKGNLSARAYWNMTWGLPYLGKMDSLKETMHSIISPRDWQQVLLDPWSARAFTQDVNIKTGEANLREITTMTRDNAFQAIQDSASIPVFTRGGDSNTLFDGGLRNHIPSRAIIEKYGRKIKKLVSIYSRPKDIEDYLDPKWKPRNFLSMAERSSSIQNFAISEADALYELLMSQIMGFDLEQYFLPAQTDGFYDLDNMRELYRLGYDHVINNR